MGLGDSGAEGLVIGTQLKFTIPHYYLLKFFMLEVRVKFY